MGIEVTDSAPIITPNWSVMSSALKATARIAGKNRLRSCQRIFRE